MPDEAAEAANLESARRLGAFLAETQQRFGVAPGDVEEKAALEARRAAETAVSVAAAAADEATAPDFAAVFGAASGAEPETRWIQEKMETPGVQFYDYEYTLRLAVPFGRGHNALARVRDYWTSRGMDVVPEAESPAGDVVASPGKGGWTLRAGILDPLKVFVRVTSGPVLTSSSPLENEREA